MDKVACHAAKEQGLDARLPAPPDDDLLNVMLFGKFDKRFGRGPVPDNRFMVDACRCQLLGGRFNDAR